MYTMIQDTMNFSGSVFIQIVRSVYKYTTKEYCQGFPKNIACVFVFVCCRPATPSKTPPPPDEETTSLSPAPTPPPRPITPSEPVSELKLTEPHKFEIPRLKSPVKKFVPSPPTKPKRSVLHRYISASRWRLLRLFVVNSDDLGCI